MQLKTLKINNLRNLKSIDIEFDTGLNFLIGDNGAGKTSVLEAIVVLAKGRSFRSGQIAALVGPESEQFRAVATTKYSNQSEQTLGIERSKNTWKARRNGEDVKQISDLAVHMPLILIEPTAIYWSVAHRMGADGTWIGGCSTWNMAIYLPGVSTQERLSKEMLHYARKICR